MISFECDYNNGAHPKVLEALVRTNGEQTLTYGFDSYSERAKEKIRRACECDDAEVFLLVGGTQTNTTVIDGMLQAFEAVISCRTGHIAIHEAGAIERSGHKVITLAPSELPPARGENINGDELPPARGENTNGDGKLTAKDLADYMAWFEGDESRDHLAQPGMVYISFPTELGTLYSAAEIEAIYDVCRQYGLQLFIDGARLGYGLAASRGDVTLPWLCRHCDALYIGGTKVGALCGEAVVFTHGNAPRHFFSIVKQHGALLAKGRLVGIQFDALFSPSTPNPSSREEGNIPLYLEISEHAIQMAMKLREVLRRKGFPFFIDSPTNQQFVIVPNEEVSRLERLVGFTHWEPFDSEHTVCRFVTSWATTTADIDELEKLL